jgi:hypothetical protein
MGPFIGEIKDQITLSVLTPANHYITTQPSHRVITDFYNLQSFLCRSNQRLMCVPCHAASVREPSVTHSLRQRSNDNKAHSLRQCSNDDKASAFQVRLSPRRRLGLSLTFSPECTPSPSYTIKSRRRCVSHTIATNLLARGQASLGQP